MEPRPRKVGRMKSDAVDWLFPMRYLVYSREPWKRFRERAEMQRELEADLKRFHETRSEMG